MQTLQQSLMTALRMPEKSTWNFIMFEIATPSHRDIRDNSKPTIVKKNRNEILVHDRGQTGVDIITEHTNKEKIEVSV